MKDIRRLGLDAHNWYGVAQGGTSYLNPGKLPRGLSMVTGFFVCKDL